jgi:hypothetical protein
VSVRDVEATLADALGAEAALSKSTVSRVCQAIKDEFATWTTRRLEDLELDYLFLDGSYFRMHTGARAEPVLAAWGITTTGAPVLVGLAPSGSESVDAWADFLDELRERGLRPPLLAITDGGDGLVGAVERKLPRSLRQRCLIHRARNFLAKIPTEAQTELKAAYWQIFDPVDNVAPGQRAVAVVQARIDAFAARYGRDYPAAVRCLLTDREQLTSYPRFPAEHHRRIRHSNSRRAHLRRDPPPSQSHRPAARGNQLPVPGLGRARPRLSRLAWLQHDTGRNPTTPRPAPPIARPTHRNPSSRAQPTRKQQNCRSRRLKSQTSEGARPLIYTGLGTRPTPALAGGHGKMAMSVDSSDRC